MTGSIEGGIHRSHCVRAQLPNPTEMFSYATISFISPISPPSHSNRPGWLMAQPGSCTYSRYSQDTHPPGPIFEAWESRNECNSKPKRHVFGQLSTRSFQECPSFWWWILYALKIENRPRDRCAFLRHLPRRSTLDRGVRISTRLDSYWLWSGSRAF